MQDGSFNTFSFTVMLAAEERMHEDMYRSRCPQVRLAKWLELKRLPTCDLDGEIKLSENRFNDGNEVSAVREPPVTPTKETSVLIPEGTHVCIQKAKHLHLFGILAHDGTGDLSFGTCILAATSGEPSSYKMFSLAKLVKAVGRLELNVYKNRCPSKDLDNLLAFEKCDEKAMRAKIQQSSAAYNMESEAVVATQMNEAVMWLQHK
jgi:hypothetical protein